MPELPEVETVARSLRPRIVGRTITDVTTSGLALRHPVDEKALRAACSHARVESVERHGKYLLIHLSGAQVLVVHLGMSGRLVVVPTGVERAAHTHAIFRLDGDELRYIDPRRFGLVLVYPADRVAGAPELEVLGVDPLAGDFTVGYLAAELAASRRDIKQFLLDQSHVAGLGNIYVCEALFRAGISPRRRADRLGPVRAARLHPAICDVLTEAVQHRGTTFRDYVDGGGEPGGNQFRLDVYGREDEPCRRCGRTIRRIVQGARSTFFCPGCQR